MRDRWKAWLVEAHAVGPVGGQHPAGGQLVHHPGHGDEGVAVVGGCEQPLVLGLKPVVELLDNPLAELFDARKVTLRVGETRVLRGKSA